MKAGSGGWAGVAVGFRQNKLTRTSLCTTGKSHTRAHSDAAIIVFKIKALLFLEFIKNVQSTDSDLQTHLLKAVSPFSKLKTQD